MKFFATHHRRFNWINLPGALLMMLLQRTPLLNLFVTAENTVLRSPASAVLKSSVAGLVALGALHSRAGATELVTNVASPLRATVGAPVATVAFGLSGTQTNPSAWSVSGALAPGLTLNGRAATGSFSGNLVLAGTPTAAGTFQLNISGSDAGFTSAPYPFTVIVTGGVTASAPSFTTQPTAQIVTAGATVTFTIAADGSPAPTFQWFKNGSTVVGATNSALVISGATAADVGSYTVVVTNSLGSATSNPATLTVTGINAAPTATVQPTSVIITAGMTATFTATVSGFPTPTFQWSKGGIPISGATSATLVISGATTADAGTYTLVATNSNGSATSNAATLTVNAVVTTRPVITTQPVSLTRAVGVSAVFTVVATGSPSIQWRKNGVNIPGATTATLTFSALTTSDTASYDAVLTNAIGTEFSNTAALIVTAPLTARLSNLSVRTTLAANQVLIVGLTMSGGAKSVLVRAAGPGLGFLGVPGTMADPKLALFNGSTQIAENDNWGTPAADVPALSSTIAAVGAFAFPSAASLDAALLRAIDGGRTVQVSGPGAGNVIVEAYDAGLGNTPRLTNLSALNFAGTGGDVLIAGFTVTGTGTKNVLIRAAGPSLGALGVPGTLVDPKLELFTATSPAVKIGENDNYSASLPTVFSSVGAFPFIVGAKDAALIVSLPAGGYTVQVSGADGGTGSAIVEVYELP
ncbi:MAG: immunoglobulin domain-containing protein [Undibacterium sp.]|nr:immunoglobulin domain-containing protein [Opitutaceae bacterium]